MGTCKTAVFPNLVLLFVSYKKVETNLSLYHTFCACRYCDRLAFHTGIFYFYTAILGTHLLALDILIFIISVFITFFVIYKLTLSCRISGNAGWILLVALGVSFWVK